MGSDACFRMGFTHQICQDYAIAGALSAQGRRLPYAVVSDGCSGSEHTDFGARFLVRATELALEAALRYDPLGEALGMFHADLTIAHANRMVTVANLGRRSLDATLIRAVQLPSGRIVVHQAGDGVVAARDRVTRTIAYQTMKFGGNMPYYLSYLLNDVDRARYLNLAGTVEIVRGSNPTGDWNEEVSVSTLTSDPVTDYMFDAAATDLVLIMSDGAESFQDMHGNPVPLTAVLEQLFDMKSSEGEFVTRRCTKFLTKFCAETGWRHYDDLSVAGIYVPEAP